MIDLDDQPTEELVTDLGSYLSGGLLTLATAGILVRSASPPPSISTAAQANRQTGAQNVSTGGS